MLIRSASFKCLWAKILALDPVVSTRRKVQNETYLVAISTEMLTTLPSVHLNFRSSGKVGLVPVFAIGDNKSIHSLTMAIINEACNNGIIYTLVVDTFDAEEKILHCYRLNCTERILPLAQ